MRYGPQDMTNMMGIGSYVGEVRRGPNGQVYQWVEVLPRQYAVFEHKGPLDQLPQTLQYIYKTWLPTSHYVELNAPELERYSADFNPKLHTGKLEICVPVDTKA